MVININLPCAIWNVGQVLHIFLNTSHSLLILNSRIGKHRKYVLFPIINSGLLIHVLLALPLFTAKSSSSTCLLPPFNQNCPVDGKISGSLVLRHHQNWPALQCCMHGPSSVHIQPEKEKKLYKLPSIDRWSSHLFEMLPGKTLRGT